MPNYTHPVLDSGRKVGDVYALLTIAHGKLSGVKLVNGAIVSDDSLS